MNIKRNSRFRFQAKKTDVLVNNLTSIKSTKKKLKNFFFASERTKRKKKKNLNEYNYQAVKPHMFTFCFCQFIQNRILSFTCFVHIIPFICIYDDDDRSVHFTNASMGTETIVNKHRLNNKNLLFEKINRLYVGYLFHSSSLFFIELVNYKVLLDYETF